VNTGKQLWLQNLGTIQKASPVFADGRLYVGTENGKFYILKPSARAARLSIRINWELRPHRKRSLLQSAVSNGRVVPCQRFESLCDRSQGNSAHATSPAPTEVTANPNGTPRTFKLYQRN
jgi:hypothetical protein